MNLFIPDIHTYKLNEMFLANVAIVTTTLEDRILWANRAAERLLGCKLSELKNRSFLTFFHSDLPVKDLGRNVEKAHAAQCFEPMSRRHGDRVLGDELRADIAEDE